MFTIAYRWVGIVKRFLVVAVAIYVMSANGADLAQSVIIRSHAHESKEDNQNKPKPLDLDFLKSTVETISEQKAPVSQGGNRKSKSNKVSVLKDTCARRLRELIAVDDILNMKNNIDNETWPPDFKAVILQNCYRHLKVYQHNEKSKTKRFALTEEMKECEQKLTELGYRISRRPGGRARFHLCIDAKEATTALKKQPNDENIKKYHEAARAASEALSKEIVVYEQISIDPSWVRFKNNVVKELTKQRDEWVEKAIEADFVLRGHTLINAANKVVDFASQEAKDTYVALFEGKEEAAKNRLDTEGPRPIYTKMNEKCSEMAGQLMQQFFRHLNKSGLDEIKQKNVYNAIQENQCKKIQEQFDEYQKDQNPDYLNAANIILGGMKNNTSGWVVKLKKQFSELQKGQQEVETGVQEHIGALLSQGKEASVYRVAAEYIKCFKERLYYMKNMKEEFWKANILEQAVAVKKYYEERSKTDAWEALVNGMGDVNPSFEMADRIDKIKVAYDKKNAANEKNLKFKHNIRDEHSEPEPFPKPRVTEDPIPTKGFDKIKVKKTGFLNWLGSLFWKKPWSWLNNPLRWLLGS